MGLIRTSRYIRAILTQALILNMIFSASLNIEYLCLERVKPREKEAFWSYCATELGQQFTGI